MEGRRTDNRHMTVKTQISRDGDPEQPDLLNLLDPVKLIVWKVVIQRITLVKFRMDHGAGNGAGCFEVNLWADAKKIKHKPKPPCPNVNQPVITAHMCVHIAVHR